MLWLPQIVIDHFESSLTKFINAISTLKSRSLTNTISIENVWYELVWMIIQEKVIYTVKLRTIWKYTYQTVLTCTITNTTCNTLDVKSYLEMCIIYDACFDNICYITKIQYFCMCNAFAIGAAYSFTLQKIKF